MKSMKKRIIAGLVALAVLVPGGAVLADVGYSTPWQGSTLQGDGWIVCTGTGVGSEKVKITVTGTGEHYRYKYTDPFFISRTRTSGAYSLANRSVSYFTGNGKIKLMRGSVAVHDTLDAGKTVFKSVIAGCY